VRCQGVLGGANMPRRGSTTFRHSMFWIGASLAALLVGLAMLMHEQHAHDVCAASIHGLNRKLLQTPPACGFADTVFWAGMVVFFAGAVSLIAAMWSGVTILSSSFHVKGRPTRRTMAWSSREHHAPVNQGAGLPPASPLWLSKLASPAPFEVPARRHNGDQATTDRSTSSAPDTGDINLPTSEQMESNRGSVRVVATQGTVTYVPSQGTVRVEPTRDAEQTVLDPSFVQAPVRSAPRPVPAWYPDPEVPDAIRWWDGNRWGESRPRPQ
jgi:Protein of unknown function (DUF2510)